MSYLDSSAHAQLGQYSCTVYLDSGGVSVTLG